MARMTAKDVPEDISNKSGDMTCHNETEPDKKTTILNTLRLKV
jgi:hypothetical protein